MKSECQLILTLTTLFATIYAKPTTLALLFNDGRLSTDIVSRFVLNLKFLKVDTVTFNYNGTVAEYRNWMINQTLNTLSSESSRFVILVDSIAAIVGSKFIDNIANLKSDKIPVFTCPKRFCDNATETCTDITLTSFPSVFVAYENKLIDILQNNDKSIFGLDIQHLFNHNNEKWLTIADSPLEMSDLDNNSIRYSRHENHIIVACDNQTRFLNERANYMMETTQCHNCHVNNTAEEIKDLPSIAVALFIEYYTPFLDQHLEKIWNLSYDKSKIDLLIHNKMDYHNKTITIFIEKAISHYHSLKYISSFDDITENDAKIDSIKYCFDREEIKFLFIVSSTALLEKADIIENLIIFNRSVIAPMLIRQYSFWSNFWGSLSDTEYYNRSFDYLSIVKGETAGIWNVPHVTDCYLLNRLSLQILHNKRITGDPELGFARLLRNEGIFMFISNLHPYGKLTNNENYNTSFPRPDLYQLFDNYDQWTDKYIHPDVWSIINGNDMPQELLTDTYYFPLTTNAFCDDLVATAVASNAWSGGKAEDSRLPGGYENVPTDDIHMKQIGFSEAWHVVLQNFIMPIQRKVFQGYTKEPPSAPLSFVVRYHPEKQNRLKPHHDSSTYTLNMALNRASKDYEGGGVRFIRYETVIKDIKKGWVLMHPGRLTHLHEGLPTINGTRYIFVSFVDP